MNDDKNEATVREAIEDGVGIAETPQSNVDMSTTAPLDKETKERWGNDSAFIQRIKQETEQAEGITTGM